MRIPNHQDSGLGGTNMTPMIDVVFLLIIFFLVSSHLARQESRLPVELPVADSHDPLSVAPVTVTVTVDRDHRTLFKGRSVSIAELGSIFADAVSKEGAMASLRIRTDGSVPYRIVEPILKAAATTSLLDIKLAVKESSR